jgi:hypothetical protein
MNPILFGIVFGAIMLYIIWITFTDDNFNNYKKKNMNTIYKDIKFKVGDVISDGFYQVTVDSVQEDYYIVTSEEIKNDAHIVDWIIYFKDQDKWKLVNNKD